MDHGLGTICARWVTSRWSTGSPDAAGDLIDLYPCGPVRACPLLPTPAVGCVHSRDTESCRWAPSRPDAVRYEAAADGCW